MYSRNFLCKEAKIKQHTSLKKELCEIGEKQYGNPDSHDFFLSFNVNKRMKRKQVKDASLPSYHFCTRICDPSCVSNLIKYIVDGSFLFYYIWNQQKKSLKSKNCNFLYTCMQNPHLRTVYRQREWPLLAPVRKIMVLGRKKMALGCKVISLG